MNIKYLSGIGLSFLFTLSVTATPIYFDDGSIADASDGSLTDPFDPIVGVPFSGNPDVGDLADLLLSEAGLIVPALEVVYKAEVGEEDDLSTAEDESATVYTGSAASWYTATFDDAPLDPADATISHVPGMPTIGGDPLFLVAKGGSGSRNASDPNDLYIWDLSSWDGEMPLNIVDMWNAGNGRGAISNVAIVAPAGRNVPVGGPTIAMLGLALMGLAGIRRVVN